MHKLYSQGLQYGEKVTLQSKCKHFKLTEDDIQVEEGFVVIPNNLVYSEALKIKNQILQNQEDAEKWNHELTQIRMNEDNISQDNNNMEIVERLKKRIEELKTEKMKDDCLNYTTAEWALFELQRILEGDSSDIFKLREISESVGYYEEDISEGK